MTKDIFNFLKPKNELEGHEVQSDNKPYIPDELWVKCPICKNVMLSSDLEDNYKVCLKCGYHFRIPARQRIEMTVDEGTFEEFDKDMMSNNIIDFPEYTRKLKNAKINSGENESVITGVCTIGGQKTVIAVMNSQFMMGSMGTVTGEKITRAFEYASENRLPVVIFTVSGGARMQEGILSLMQMAKTSGAVKLHSDHALIGFAGPRVIEQTIRQKLPKDFQSAEFLLEKGFVDAVVERKDMKDTLAKLLKLHSESEVADIECL